MKYNLLISMAFLLPFWGYAQKELPPDARPLNSIYINFLGVASIVSANYERILVSRDNFMLAAKMGVGINEEFCILWCNDDLIQFTTYPVSLTANWGRGRNFFELGLGGTFINQPEKNMIYPVVGYRLYPLTSKRVQFRFYFNIWPVNGSPEYILFIPIGFSSGLSF